LSYDLNAATNFYMELYDIWMPTTGTLNSFSVEVYSDYANGVLDSDWTSTDTPMDTIQGTSVIAQVSVGSGPPEVESTNLEAITSAKITAIEVYFSEDMAALPLADLDNYALALAGGGDISIDDIETDPDHVILDVNGGTPLAEGDYVFTILSGGLTDLGGTALDGDGDGAPGDNYVMAFTYQDIGIFAGTMTSFGGRISFYDTDADSQSEINIRPCAAVSGNDTAGITRIILEPNYSPFGVVIEQKAGAATPIAIIDHTFGPIEISYLVVDANISTLSLNSDLGGYNINGVVFESGLTMPLDVDGDGDTEDLTGLVTLGTGRGNAQTIISRAGLLGDVVIGGTLTKMVVTGAGGLQGDLVAAQGIGSLTVRPGGIGGSVTAQQGNIDMIVAAGPISAPISAATGRIGKIVASGGTTGAAVVTAGAGLGVFCAYADVQGDINVTGGMTKFALEGGNFSGALSIAGGDLTVGRVIGDVNGDMELGGNVARLMIKGNLNGELTIGGNAQRIDVLGQIGDNGDAGDPIVEVAGGVARLKVIGVSEAQNAIADDIEIGGTLGWFMLRRGAFDGDLQAADMGRIYYNTANGITGNITSEQDLTLLRSIGPVAGNIDVARHARGVYALGGVSAGATIEVGSALAGSGLDRLHVRGNLEGDVSVTGDLSRLAVRGNTVGNTIDVDGLLGLFVGTGDYTSANIYANALGRVLVRGNMTGTGEIHADAGSFVLDADGGRHEITDPVGQMIDNIHAYVG